MSKLETMTEYILNIDWMTTTEFCREHKVPLPTASEGVEGLLRIDAVKHRMFVEYAKKLQKESKSDTITPESLEELGFKPFGLGIVMKRSIVGLSVSIDLDHLDDLVVVIADHKDGNRIAVNNCRNLTDLKHLIRILGV